VLLENHLNNNSYPDIQFENVKLTTIQYNLILLRQGPLGIGITTKTNIKEVGRSLV
jgi:hypothetical protein